MWEIDRLDRAAKHTIGDLVQRHGPAVIMYAIARWTRLIERKVSNSTSVRLSSDCDTFEMLIGEARAVIAAEPGTLPMIDRLALGE